MQAAVTSGQVRRALQRRNSISAELRPVWPKDAAQSPLSRPHFLVPQTISVERAAPAADTARIDTTAQSGSPGSQAEICQASPSLRLCRVPPGAHRSPAAHVQSHESVVRRRAARVDSADPGSRSKLTLRTSMPHRAASGTWVSSGAGTDGIETGPTTAGRSFHQLQIISIVFRKFVRGIHPVCLRSFSKSVM